MDSHRVNRYLFGQCHHVNSELVMEAVIRHSGGGWEGDEGGGGRVGVDGWGWTGGGGRVGVDGWGWTGGGGRVGVDGWGWMGGVDGWGWTGGG